MFQVPPVSCELDSAIRRAIDAKTKPLGALGALETVAAQVARIQNTLTPTLRRCRLTLFAADHGIAKEGVSAYPQAVTRQMVANFLGGGAAANVFARTNGVELQVVDAGVAGEPMEAPGLISRRIAAGTRNFAVEPAMTAEQCETALATGETLGAGVAADAARAGAVVLVDGFISGVAALAAVQMAPALRDYLVFAHRSAEHGHGAVLAALDARPLLDLELRLGEGTGALLAWPVLRCAAAMLSEMASFESAGVSGPV